MPKFYIQFKRLFLNLHVFYEFKEETINVNANKIAQFINLMGWEISYPTFSLITCQFSLRSLTTLVKTYTSYLI